MSCTTLTHDPMGTETSLDKFGLKGGLSRMADLVSTWNRRHKTRRQFASVEHRILRDVGISAADRFIEINKPFWEA